jgi:putative phosphoribosyl transferase
MEEPEMLFRDRRHAGRLLAGKLSAYAGRRDVMVLALPRGGVPVGFEVAQSLGAPLDVFLVRKLGVPGQQELAMGAIATGGIRLVNEEVREALGIPDEVIDEVAAEEQKELLRRERLYRDDRPGPDVADRIVILVDDGLATGTSMRAAVAALRQSEPARLVVAVPVGAYETCDEFKRLVDELVCLKTPEPFRAVGLWYEDFGQTSDQEVRDLLEEAAKPKRWPPDPGASSSEEMENSGPES